MHVWPKMKVFRASNCHQSGANRRSSVSCVDSRGLVAKFSPCGAHQVKMYSRVPLRPPFRDLKKKILASPDTVTRGILGTFQVLTPLKTRQDHGYRLNSVSCVVWHYLRASQVLGSTQNMDSADHFETDLSTIQGTLVSMDQ